MSIWRSGVGWRSGVRIGAEQAVGHLIHLRLADKLRAGAQQTVDNGGVVARRRMGCGPERMTIGGDMARDVDILLHDEGFSLQRANADGQGRKSQAERVKRVDGDHAPEFRRWRRAGKALRFSCLRAA